jgi:hypothetical protein
VNGRQAGAGSSTVGLDVDAIQGVVLRGYRMSVARHVFLRFGPAGAALPDRPRRLTSRFSTD